MSNTPTQQSSLFTARQLAVQIVDTLVDHGLIERSRFEDAVASVKWELDAQHAFERIILNEALSSPAGE